MEVIVEWYIEGVCSAKFSGKFFLENFFEGRVRLGVRQKGFGWIILDGRYMLYKHTLILAALIRGVYLLGLFALSRSSAIMVAILAPAASKALYAIKKDSRPDAVKHTQPSTKPISILLIMHPV